MAYTDTGAICSQIVFIPVVRDMKDLQTRVPNKVMNSCSLENICIKIVSDHVDSQVADLETMISELGSPAHVTDLQGLSENPGRSRHSILVLSIAPQTGGLQPAHLNQGLWKDLPRLIVVHHASPMADALLQHPRNAIVSWPCHRAELGFHLKRLISQYQFKLSAESTAMDHLARLHLVGRSPVFKKMVNLIVKVSKSLAPVLIMGETGAGKELGARALHYLGPHSAGPFITVNCGALPENLIVNELFGHVKGAYTDAATGQEGLVAQAQHGTLFLDEVETLHPQAQATLLRFIEEKRYRSLGSRKLVQADVRIISATNADLEQMVKKGQFRRDLLYRLNVIQLHVPPLRHRSGDIELIAEYYLTKFRKTYNEPDKYLHPLTLEWLRCYDWPGNVRELAHRLEREFLLAEGPVIFFGEACRLEDLRKKSPERSISFQDAKALAVNDFEKRYLFNLMRRTKGNVSQAARLAGKERRALGKLLKKHGIERKQFAL
jgi:DNA-binding NtrC family response regulator